MYTGRVGKTATVRSLLGMPFDPNLASTVGADATKTCVVDRKERVVNWQEKVGMEGREYDQMVAQFVAQKLETVTTEDILNERDDEGADKFFATGGDFDEMNWGDKTDLTKLDVNKGGGKPGGNNGVGVDGEDVSGSGDGDGEEGGGDLTSGDHLDGMGTPHGDEDKAQKFDEQLVLESLQNGDAVTFSMWDFGGQRVFYALHHVFLTR
jgi:GTPase SAR1 family protein